MVEETLFTKKDLIQSYGIEKAEGDNILFNITTLNKEWEKGIFSHITTNLLTKGYFNKKDDKINIPNILDLLNQANQIVKRKSNNFTEFDDFFSGKIELPNGLKQNIFIQQNELNKFTIMLPEDY